MASRHEVNKSLPITLVELTQELQQILSNQQNCYLNGSPQGLHDNFIPNQDNVFHHFRHNEQEGNKAKRTRRRPKKNKKDSNEGSTLHSVSSNSSVSTSPLKNRLSPQKGSKKILCNGINDQEASTSKTSRLPLKDTYIFSFKPSKDNICGKFIRKRTISQFINLRSFAKKCSSSCEFITGLSINTEIQKSKSQPDKSQNRKYLKKESGRDRKNKALEKENSKFPEYLSAEVVKEGLDNGNLIEGIIRINPKNFREAYVSNEDLSIQDYLISSVRDRNRALEGDEVVLLVKPKEEWVGDTTTVVVVYIKRKVHSRQAVGTLKSDPKDGEYGLFVPRDKRFPIMRISSLHLPNDFKNRSNESAQVLFVGQLLDWVTPNCAIGIIIEKLGPSGNLKVETLSLIRECNLDITPFTNDVEEYVSKFKSIPEKEYAYREDMRRKCIFTIDPATARDLDDAVSVEILANGNYEVGVHISDASYFLEEGTELDQFVSKKATTIYMVDNVYHMLPQEMCFGCSLLPGEDKLSFSVFWEITPQVQIINKRFTRTIINSCVKLAYEHAQMVIENPDKDFTSSDFPPIYNGFKPRDIVRTINILQSIAVILRENRLKNGCLRIDNLKLQFQLNAETGEPLDYSVYQSQDSHKLIEEFMLLANISVAQKIHENFPEIAFLRCHEPPKESMLVQLQNRLSIYGIHLNISSSAAIQSSLKKYYADDYIGNSRTLALNHLTAKTMTRARYFCAATAKEKINFKHYALSVPIYTHFTSPIRRYADIMVHRLLAASLDYCEQPNWDIDYVETIAKNCNIQKYQAKKAQDASMELYLAHYIETHKPFIQDCVVIDVKAKKCDVVVIKTGSVVRIYPNNCEKGAKWEYDSNKLVITFPRLKNSDKISITVELFSIVKVNLMRKDSYQLEGQLLRPIGTQCFQRKEKKGQLVHFKGSK